jgi:Family of unknown function (DUF5724)/Domain of unknown function (DUF4132)
VRASPPSITMLNPEIAQARLKEYEIKEWQSQCLAKLIKLPKELRSIGCNLLSHDETGQPIKSDNAYQIVGDAFTTLGTLTVADRLQIFQILFPKYAEMVEATWQSFDQWTYQMGYGRRSFRAPGVPEVYSSKREWWLQAFWNVVKSYDLDLPALAAWCPYMSYSAADVAGYIFAVAIDRQEPVGQEIFDILVASTKGEHEIGAMGRHVTRALLLASREEGWELMEKMLIAAQRQEGLRQTILESVDEAHPIAYQRMLQLILDENLIRFSATLRAVDVWFGFNYDVLQEKAAHTVVTQALAMLTDEQQQQSALTSTDPQTASLALWTAAFQNAIKAIAMAKELLKHPEASHRFVAIHFLAQLNIRSARLAILTLIEDPDDRVAWLALKLSSCPSEGILKAAPETFERIVGLFDRWPQKPKKLLMLVWDWLELTASKEELVPILNNYLNQRSPKLLIPYLAICDSSMRGTIAGALEKVQPIDAEVRTAWLGLLGDASSYVRQQVLGIFRKLPIESIDADATTHFIGLLTRKTSELRQGMLGLLLKQVDSECIKSAQMLLSAKDVLQRQAGLELLAEMVKESRSVEKCQEIAGDYRTKRGDKVTNPEIQLLDRIAVQESQPLTLRDALGLVKPEALPVPQPVTCDRPAELNTAAAKATLRSLDDLIHSHRQTSIKFHDYRGDVEDLLGNVTWNFPSIDSALTREENLARLPLLDVWENWFNGKRARDEDGWEILRAIAPGYSEPDWEYEDKEEAQYSVESPYYDLRATFLKSFAASTDDLRYENLIDNIIPWILYLHPPEQRNEFALNLIETVITSVDPIALEQSIAAYQPKEYLDLYDLESFIQSWVSFACPIGKISDDLFRRWWKLVTWMDASVWRRFNSRSTRLVDVMTARRLGLASEDDLIFFLLGDRALPEQAVPDGSPKVQLRTDFYDLQELTRRKILDVSPEMQEALAAADRCRQRILEIECQRGDLPTAATAAALRLRSAIGIPTVIKLLQAMDSSSLVRGHTWGSDSKPVVISHLMRISFPASSETPADFAAQVQAAKIPEEKLIQFAFFAPQWVNYIQEALQIPGFAEGVWWIHAHTKDSNWSVEQDIREVWVAQIAERTPLSAESLTDGAVDVDWFQKTYQTLGDRRWQQLDGAAQYASGGSGHQRAKQFASAMLGQLNRSELLDRITKKRHQDSVRALGLCPLDEGKKRDRDLLDRYQIYQEFIRTSKKFGAQRRASEKLAVEIGMENLARTSGYIDPQRLQWAMEAAAIADLVAKPQVVTIEETTISLSIASGLPEITIIKAGKALKAIPAKLKKNPEIEEMVDRRQDIVKQASRMRQSLEQAMNRGDSFTRQELQDLAQHPVLSPMLRKLVLIAVDPKKSKEIGYLDASGQQLENPQGSIKITADQFRIAHPHDLLMTQEWHLWQADCFSTERQQPFKQVFRELYVLTKAEEINRGSKRYEGQQVNPKQAIALFGQRGWISSPDDGPRRTFHKEGLIAAVSFANGYYTPLDVEGLTIEHLHFYHRDNWKPMPLAEVPPRIFSEVMRDLDLVVSVAHIGGVDPEASASTVEMRTSILRETCRLMKFSNVQIQGSHALIKGELGDYSVHLGSAIVHRQPGGALCILPVSSQHRGRLFLPFVDDDPKTAEIMSKVLLLAKDKEIQDPTILEQILV